MTHRGNQYLKSNQGFTLFELLIVITIISISFAVFMSIQFSFGDAEDKIKKEASRLQLLLSFAQEQSIIRAEEYGIRFYPNGYSFMQYSADTDNWNEIDDKVLGAKQFADNMELELAIEQVDIILEDKQAASNTDDPEHKIKPQVFLLSSGETTPDFIARVSVPGIDTFYEIHGSTDGKYELSKSE